MHIKHNHFKAPFTLTDHIIFNNLEDPFNLAPSWTKAPQMELNIVEDVKHPSLAYLEQIGSQYARQLQNSPDESTAPQIVPQHQEWIPILQ